MVVVVDMEMINEMIIKVDTMDMIIIERMMEEVIMITEDMMISEMMTIEVDIKGMVIMEVIIMIKKMMIENTM